LKLWPQVIERNRAWDAEPEVLRDWPRNLGDKEIAPSDRTQFRRPPEGCLRGGRKVGADHRAKRPVAACPGFNACAFSDDEHRNWGYLGDAFGNAADQPSGLFRLAERSDHKQPRVTGARDIDKFLVRNAALHNRLDINSELRCDLGGLITNTLLQRAGNRVLLAYGELDANFLDDVNELQRHFQPLG
jgi:hypothetical protein